MPGNGLEDRVHNFFAQDSSFLGQHHSQAMEGKWTVPNSKFWAGSHRQDNSVNSASNYADISQNSDTDRGAISYPHHATQELNFTQPNLRPDPAKSQSLNEQLNSNGFMHEKQFFLSRENEANFLKVDRNPNQLHFITSKGSSDHESQQSGGLEHLTRVSVRQETSESPVNFDIFGAQQQRSHQQSNIQPALQRQQPGVNNMQQLQQQQQLMIRKMQELHRQQQLLHFDLRQHNSNNEVTPFAKPTCSNQPSFAYGNPNSNMLQYPRAAESGINWMNCSPPTLQGSSSKQGFPPNRGQTQQLVNLVSQQADQSLYGVPISSSKGLPMNQYPRMVTARSSMPQLPIFSNHLQGNELNFMADQVSPQSEPSISKHKFQKENIVGLGSGTNTEIGKMGGGLWQGNSLSRSGLQQDFLGSQEVAVQLETLHEKLRGQVVSPQNEVALDPAEEKILFISDDNIWDAFGTLPQMNREVGDAIDYGGLSNGLPSMQSGSWSALMQSAVAETSSSKVVSPEKRSCSVLQKNDDLSRSHPPLTHIGSSIQQAPPGQNIRINSALNSESFSPPNDIGTANAMGLNQFGEKFQNGPDQTVQAETSTEANSPIWMTGHTGTGRQSNGWNPQATIPTRGDRAAITRLAEKLQQNFQNSEVKVQQDMVHGSCIRNSGSVPSTSGHVNSRVSNHKNHGVLSSKEIQWNNAHPPARCQNGGSLGRLLHQGNDPNYVLESTNSHEKGEVQRNEVENCDGMENSSDSHLSNLSQHTSGGIRESGLSDVSDSQTFPTGKQKSANQLSRKVSASRTFPYHLKKLDEDAADAERTHCLKQSSDIQAIMSQQYGHFGQSKLFAQIPRNAGSTQKGQSSELHRDNRDIAKDLSHGNLSGQASDVPLPCSRTTNALSLSNTSLSGQNMLELLHKVDLSREQGAIMQFKASEYNSSSQHLEAEYSDGYGRFQHSQSPVSQGFRLQLGPPSQKLRVLEHLVTSQNDQDIFNSNITAAGAGKGDTAQQMVPSPSVQSLPPGNCAQGNLWTNPPKLHNMGIQFQPVSSHIAESHLPNIEESSSVSLVQCFSNSDGVANGEEQRLRESSAQPMAFVNGETVPEMVKSSERAPCTKRLSDGSPSSSAEQKDIHAFGQSLKPNSISHQNHLSQSHMEVLKDRETDLEDRASKRMRGPDNIVDVQQGAVRAGEHNEPNAVIGGSLGSRSGLPSQDGKSLGFSWPLDLLQRKAPYQGNVASHDSLGLKRDVSQSVACSDHSSVTADHLQVSPLMSSSWLSQYGTSSNEKMLQIYGAQHVTPIKPEETSFAKASSDVDPVNSEVKGTAAPSDTSQINSSHQSSSLVANGHFTSLWSTHLNITGQSVVSRPMKRTNASPEAHPWHRAISQDSQDLWSLSMAEADWNEAAGHLTERVEDHAELIEDGPVLRSRKRLILTTQLMQQLLRPAAANVTCSDASRNYDILAYCISRIALGDACSMASRSTILGLPFDNKDILLAKGKPLKRTGGLSHGKATEELMGRARKLENDLLRLDRSASISGLQVDCQEPKKLSIINRFAKFHGHRQHDKTQKCLPRRYVTALAMPKTLPENVLCLSL